MLPSSLLVVFPENVNNNFGSSTTSAVHVCRIPRSREVKQSYVTSVWTTLVALFACFSLLWRGLCAHSIIHSHEIHSPQPHFLTHRGGGPILNFPNPSQGIVVPNLAYKMKQIQSWPPNRYTQRYPGSVPCQRYGRWKSAPPCHPSFSRGPRRILPRLPPGTLASEGLGCLTAMATTHLCAESSASLSSNNPVSVDGLHKVVVISIYIVVSAINPRCIVFIYAFYLFSCHLCIMCMGWE